MKAVVASLIFVFAAAVAGVVPAAAPEGTDVLAELESVAVIDQKVMVPMRDGIPMSTSNYFDAGHRIRIEVSSSNFPEVHSQPQYGRQQLRRDGRRGGAQHGAPLATVPVTDRRASRELDSAASTITRLWPSSETS